MVFYDVFNGDADGICSLIQLRLNDPKESMLVTGVKRDISLLKKIESEVSSDDEVIVLDVSMDKNISSLKKILSTNAKVLYADHHNAKDIPKNKNLTALIDFDANSCTSLIVNKYLNNKYISWAIVGAFGDNLNKVSEQLATTHEIPSGFHEKLSSLGKYINYNGYGASYDDLHFSPEDLYIRLSQYSCPIDFIEDDTELFSSLEKNYFSDFEKVNSLIVEDTSPSTAVVKLPDAAWARRVSGVYANDLANKNPDRAHAIFSLIEKDVYQISVRAPINKKFGADKLCLKFDTGGGRAAAAGINYLPAESFKDFIRHFQEAFK